MKKIFLIVAMIWLGFSSATAQTIVTGKASLERIDNGVYEISKEDGTVQQIDLNSTTQAEVPGTLAVLFSDCVSVREAVLTEDRYTPQMLQKMVEAYNNCDYRPYAPSDEEIAKAASFQGDEFQFYGGIGGTLNRIGFFGGDEDENLLQGQLQAGVAVTPGFTGALQHNLYFTLEASAGFSGDKDFDNSPFATNFRKNSYRLQLGSEFRFMKDASIRPMIGVGIGGISDSYKGSYNGDDFDITGGNVFVSPRAGIFFDCENGRSIGLIASYISSYDNDLSFPKNGDRVPFDVNSHQFSLGINFYF